MFPKSQFSGKLKALTYTSFYSWYTIIPSYYKENRNNMVASRAESEDCPPPFPSPASERQLPFVVRCPLPFPHTLHTLIHTHTHTLYAHIFKQVIPCTQLCKYSCPITVVPGLTGLSVRFHPCVWAHGLDPPPFTQPFPTG